MTNVDYDIFSKNFQEVGLDISFAEVQGMISGYLILEKSACFQTWVGLVRDLLPWAELKDQGQEEVANLFLSVHMALVQSQEHITIITPDHSESPVAYLNALGQWAQGFLYTFGITAGADTLLSDPVVKETIDEIIACSHIKADPDSTADFSDLEFALLREHLEKSVSFVHAHINKAQEHKH